MSMCEANEYTVITLPDYLDDGMELLSIGLNPSINSVRAGFYFATPQNRFWKALNQSRLTPGNIPPGVAGIERLFREHHIGFTDVVKRPTRGARDLRSADYRRWAPVLLQRIRHHRPMIAWFHGKLACRYFLRHGLQSSTAPEWGEQSWRIDDTVVFVTPNPSPANAAYSLAALVQWYDALAAVAGSLRE